MNVKFKFFHEFQEKLIFTNVFVKLNNEKKNDTSIL